MHIPEFAVVGHGENCECKALASAAGVASSAVNFDYCRLVLQKRWGMRCNHGSRVSEKRRTPVLPTLDPHDAVQAILAVNAISATH